MQEYIDKLLEKSTVEDEHGIQYPLHSGIKKSEGEFLKKIISENGFRNTIEIGCAYGISSLYICSAHLKQPEAHHTIIDPFQTDWKNIGVLNLKRAGFNSFSLIQERSEFALPILSKDNRRFDFAFIDGWHTFDHTLIDFFYLNKMLEVGGVIAFHDVDMPSINKLLRYILSYPSYEFLGSIQGIVYPIPLKRKVLNGVLKIIGSLSKVIPAKNVNEIFSNKIVKNDHSLGLNATIIAIRKTQEDNRDWKWYKEF